MVTIFPCFSHPSLVSYLHALLLHTDASFRVADERGWQPNLQSILNQFPLGHALKTSLPLSEVSKDLQTLSVSSKLSIDPGRFLCNYI
jgi:pyrrolidone-carboxylate peptidase